MRCIVCGLELQGHPCPRCGFDLSVCAEVFPTLSGYTTATNTISAFRDENYKFIEEAKRYIATEQENGRLSDQETAFRLKELEMVLELNRKQWNQERELLEAEIIKYKNIANSTENKRKKLREEKTRGKKMSYNPSEALPPFKKRPEYAPACGMLAASRDRIVGLRSNGTVSMAEKYTYTKVINGWENIVEVAAGDGFTVGLRADGKVLAVGNNENGACDISDWNDIASIAAGDNHTVGLRSDGSVCAIGKNDAGQCDVQGWSEIVKVYAAKDLTVGLCQDGTVCLTGNDWFQQYGELSNWTEIKAIAIGGGHIVGLRRDGSVLAAGSNFFTQCNVSAWTDIVGIAAGAFHTAGLRRNGTVITVGRNQSEQLDRYVWRKIYTIAAASNYTVGLRKNGCVCAEGEVFEHVTEWQLTAAYGSEHQLEKMLYVFFSMFFREK